MSRRYGRNQRRKAREAQQLLEMLLRQTRASLQHESETRLREKRRRLEVERDLVDWAARIVTLLGPDSAFAHKLSSEGVNASLFEAVALQGNPFPVLPDQRLDWLPPEREALMVQSASKVVNLFAVYAGIRTSQVFQRYRLELLGPDGAAALAMDAETLRRLRAAGDPSLARYLLEALVKPWMAGRIG